jgi:photosystem II stability/assembly factor-like uncharacterized protein
LNTEKIFKLPLYYCVIIAITAVFFPLFDFASCSGESNIIPVIKEEAQWLAVGQGGGGALVDVVTHPTDSNIVWVVTDLTGIFKSTDSGVTFTCKSGPVEREELLFEWMRSVSHELVYDLSDPSIMYWAMDGGIYTTPGLYKSTDGGESWFKIPGSPDLAPGAIVVDNNGIIYGVKHKKFYISTDKGETWQRKADVPTWYGGDDYYWRRRDRIFIYTTLDNTVIIGDRYKDTGIFYTTDRGDSWTQSLKGKEIMDVACSPIVPGLIMALEQDGTIFRSVDDGKNFETIKRISNSHYVWGQWPAYYGGIAINSVNHVMAIGRRELGISTDGGITFSVFNEAQLTWDTGGNPFPSRQDRDCLFKCTKLSAAPFSDNWYTVDGHIVKMSKDNGASWIGRFKGINILCVYTPPVVDKTNPDVIHVGNGDNGHLYSTDGGITWKTSETTYRNIDGLAQDPNNPGIWYKMYGRNSLSGQVFKSEDGGVNWQKIGGIPMPGFRGRSENDPSFYNGWIGWLAVDPTNSKRIYATHRASDGLYLSEDGGRRFRRVLELVRPWQLEVTARGTVFICTWDSKGLYRSTDHGNSFEKINELMVHDFTVHPGNDDIIYANAGSFTHAWASARIRSKYERNRDHENEGRGKLYKTIDGGKRWTMLGAYDGFALYIEPNYPNVMLMSTRDGGQGIMRSNNSGENWISIHGSHNNYHPRGFVYGGIPGRVYSWNHNMERVDNIHIDSLFVPEARE